MRDAEETLEWLTGGRVIVAVQHDPSLFWGSWRWMLMDQVDIRAADVVMGGVGYIEAYVLGPGSITPMKTHGRARTKADACEKGTAKLAEIVKLYRREAEWQSSSKGWEICDETV